MRFSPDGEKVLSVGLDKKGFLLDGKTGEKVGRREAKRVEEGRERRWQSWQEVEERERGIAERGMEVTREMNGRRLRETIDRSSRRRS